MTRGRHARWGIVLIAAGSVLALACTTWPGTAATWATAVTQNVLTVAFVVVSFRQVKLGRGGQWWLISTYAVGFAVAQVGWTLAGLPSGPTPLGLWPDVVYAITLPLGVAGLLWLAFLGLRRREALRVMTDAAVVASGLLLFGWVAIFQITGLDERVAGRGMAMLFPFLDLVAGAVIITAAIYQPHRPRLMWLACVIPVAAVSDAMSALQPDPRQATFAVAAILAATWLAAPSFLLVAVAIPDDDANTFPLHRDRRSSVSVFVLLGLLGAFLAMVFDHSLTGPAMYLALALGVAVVVNQISVFRELRTLLDAHAVALEALRSSEEEFRLTFEGAPVGIILFEKGVLLAANPTAHAMLGLDGRTGVPAREFVALDVVPHFTDDQWTHLSDEIATVDHEFRWTRPDGVTAWMHLTLARNPRSGDDRVIATVEDVTERKAVTDRLAHLAVHDGLTGLPNRVAFMGSLELALTDPNRSIAVAFLDLDRFKVINDSVGHGSGDRVLQAVAERLIATVGDRASIARFAGDEFTILVLDRDRAEVAELIEQVQSALGEPLTLAEGIETYPTASVGVAFASPGDAVDDLMARADAAMYRAKERGRNTYELYDEAIDAGAHAELRLVGELHRALEREELRLYYQPVVDARTAEVTGFEALIRWQHPQRGLLAPGEFIGAAEASGLITPIGEWVMREALGQLATWRRAEPGRRLTMAVNVAARQVSDELPDTVAAILEETGVDADLVWLELTESALMFNSRNAETVLGQLRELGVHMSVDDFGTGYSSLTYLQRLPIEGIKLDQSFVAGLGSRERDEAICHAVISLGQALGLRTVAEGVETERQLRRLLDMGCEQAQGYLFGRPAPAVGVADGGVTRDGPGPAEPVWSTSDPTTASAIR